ncbi:putative aminopeptidase-2, partial [Glandiceps talaboti]
MTIVSSISRTFLSRYMEYGLTENMATTIIRSVLQNSPIGYSLAWEFTMNNWNELKQTYGNSAFDVIWQSTSYMNTESDLMKLEAFATKYYYMPGFPESTYESNIHKVKLNIDWMKRNYDAVHQQLMDATKTTEEPPVEKEPFDGRLPETLVPSNYDVTLTPYLDDEDGDKQFSFDGRVGITFEVTSNTDVIVLHIHGTIQVNTSVDMITVTPVNPSGQPLDIVRTERVEKYEFIKIYVEADALQAGQEYVLEIQSFTGTLKHADFDGLYLSNYTEGGDQKHLVATQFEATAARRAFPCLDEPQLKAYFEVTIIHKNTRVALCNMPVESTTADADGWNTTVFQRTNVVMPTYLIAIVVADFYSVEMTTPNGVQFRVWARKEESDNLDYALQTGSKMLTYFEDYWDIPYPLPKEDMVAIPDFASGAMENWGLILYRETALLYDPGYNTEMRKHSVAGIIAHELAHMWFGNLVTLEWWDHLWLNEGYASFYEYPAMDDADPTWDSFNQFHPRDDLYRAFDYDDSWSSLPVVRPVGWPDDINRQFNTVVYSKGSCLNMMMRTFLGYDTFKEGLQNYLNTYNYSNTVSDQLFEKLTEADQDKKKTDVKEVMDTWILQMGYPIITLSRDGNSIHAEQERFIMDPNETPVNDTFDYKWLVYVTYTDQDQMMFNSPNETWMNKSSADFMLSSSLSDDDWYLVNIDHRSFYRTKYENDNWDKLATYLKEQDHTTIPVRTRSQLLEDAFSIAHAHQMDQVYSIKLLEYLSKETEYLPMYTMVNRIGYTSSMLMRTAAYGYLETHIRSIINNNYWEKGWDFSHGEHIPYYKQYDAINTACYYGHQDCVANAISQFTQWLDDMNDDSIIHVNMKYTVYCAAIKYGPDSLWERTWSLYDSDSIPSGERSSIRSALACSRTQWIIERYMEYGLTENMATTIIGHVLTNSPIGYSLAWEFTMNNWNELKQTYGNSAFNVVWQFTSYMNTESDLMKLEAFATKYYYMPGFPESTYESNIHKVKLNIDWMKRNYDAVHQQLMDATKATEEPPVEKEPFDGRLPETLVPSNYDVTLTPYLDDEDGDKQFSFDGRVGITFDVTSNTDVIVLHIHGTIQVNTSVDMITVTPVNPSGQPLDIVRTERVEKYEFIKIYVEADALQAGQEYVLEIQSFTGTLKHADFDGLYLSNYTEGGDQKHLVATQFEATAARRAFPCLDEPQLKAYFEVTIIHKNTRVALCNMPVESTTADTDGWNTTVFQRTNVVMPTYLIAIVVADFYSVEMTTPNGVQFRVWARKEESDNLDYALQTGSKMLTYFEDYWDIPYPLPKEDMVAIPDFASGAMENWGLILYRETALLYDPGYNTEMRKHSVAGIIAHELAHMWFGNLVTLEWWDHLWLNEGYASFYEYPAMDDADPTWDSFNQFHPRDDLYRAFDYDDSWSSLPVVRPVGWPDDINRQFNTVVYSKGSCLNMMMRTFLGYDTFKEGLQNYLNTYNYSNTVSDQLFEKLTEADQDKKKTDVKEVMDTWILQMGYPIITLSRDGNSIHAEQERFIMDPNETPVNDTFDYKWYVYVTYTDQDHMMFSSPHEIWMNKSSADFMLSASLSDDDWYLVNIDHRAYYRTKYENDNWDKLATYLKEQDHTTIPVRTRSQLLEDAFSIAHAHQMDQVYSIKLLEYLSKETEYLPMYTMVNRIGYTRDMLRRTAAYGYLETHIRSIINNNYWEKGWDFSHAEHIPYYKQYDAINTACYYGHQDCVANAISQFTQWLDDMNDDSIIHVNMKYTVYCAAIKYGPDSLWERTWSLYDSDSIPSGERSSIRSALACSRTQWIIERYMEYGLAENMATTIIESVLTNSPIGYSLAWEFTMNNWNELKQTYGNNAFNVVWQFTSYMNTESDLMKLEAFATKYYYMPGFPESTYESNIHKVKLNIDWMKRNYDAVHQQLMDATKATEEPPVEKEPFDGRLPETLVPSNYDVTLTPYLDDEDGDKQFSFDGRVGITFEVTSNTDVIVLHIHGTIQVNTSAGMITVTPVNPSGQTLDIVRTERVEKYEFIKIYVEADALQAGQEYVLEIQSFTGTLQHADFDGLYLSNYTEGGDQKHLVATQFEATAARRAFPCLDEPQLKAYFEVTIIHKNTRVALCNMPVESTTADADGWNTTVFQRTNVVMPTYLIAIVVADFYSVEMTTPNGVQFRVWARKEESDNLDYALETGSKMLTYFEDYWDIPYPLPKEDMVAIPDFASGAMENWGLILYRETALIYDPGYNTEMRKHSVAGIIAHELAHMWFGNLVTLEWWDHLWLNEGYASFYEYPAMDDADPTWDSFNQFHPRDDLYRAFDYDDSWSSLPVVRPVGWPDDINRQFNTVVYSKGSCLNMMMRTFLGYDTFKEGLQNYLNTYNY